MPVLSVGTHPASSHARRSPLDTSLKDLELVPGDTRNALQTAWTEGCVELSSEALCGMQADDQRALCAIDLVAAAATNHCLLMGSTYRLSVQGNLG